MKKLLSIILTVILILTLVPLNTIMANAVNSGVYTYVVKNGKAIITDCSRTVEGALSIPRVLGGYPVTEIGNEAFDWCRDLTEVIIPQGVEKIGDRAFAVCDKLRQIDIPETVTSIGVEAFSSCHSLKSVSIPDSVKVLRRGVFYSCDNLTRVEMGKGVTIIENEAFSWCISLGTISFSSSVEVIGEDVFYLCESLSRIKVDPYNRYFSDIDGVLYDKEQTKLIYFPANREEDHYIVPDGVTEIADRAFDDAENIFTLTLGKDVAIYGDRLFGVTCPIYDIYVNENNPNFTSVDGVLFSKDKSKLVFYPSAKQGITYTIPSSVTEIGRYAFSGNDNFRKIEIPKNVTKISEYAFDWCTGITDITISSGVEIIEDAAFTSCYDLKNIVVDKDNKNFCVLDGVLYNKDKTNLIYYPAKKYDSTYVIPETVTRISGAAFFGNRFLTILTLPSKLKVIGQSAFEDISELVYIHYNGTVSQKKNIKIENDNVYLDTAVWCYYNNSCDTTCSDCKNTREIQHPYDNKYDKICNTCGYVRSVASEELVKENSKWQLYINGEKSNLTTLIKFKNKWFYVKKGVWDKTANTLVKYNNKWFYINDGKWASTANTLFKYSGKWFYIENGKWTTKTGIIKYKNKDFFVKGGKWDSSIATLYKKSGKLYAIKGGKWTKSKTIIKYNGKKYYCNKGYAQTAYSGKITISSKKYTVKKGIIK